MDIVTESNLSLGLEVIHVNTADIFFGIFVLQIKSHWKQQELTAKSWDGYVSKTSNYEILKVLSLTSADITSSHHC